MKRRFLIFTILLTTSLLTMAQKKVAVWETKCTDNSVSSFQRIMVRGGMESAVANAPGYTGYDRASFDAIINEHNFQRSGAVSESDIKRLGEMAGVQYIIVPEAMVEGNDFYIIVKMLDVETGEFGAAYDALCAVSEIKTACSQLGALLFRNVPSGNTTGVSRTSNGKTANRQQGAEVVIAQTKTIRVAILETVDKFDKVDYGVEFQLRAFITDAVNKTPGYEGYDRVDMTMINKEHDFQRTGMVSDADIKKLGDMTGASSVVVAEAAAYGGSGDRVIIAAKIINIESGRIENSTRPKVATIYDDGMEKACIEVVAELLGSTGNTSRP